MNILTKIVAALIVFLSLLVSRSGMVETPRL